MFPVAHSVWVVNNDGELAALDRSDRYALANLFKALAIFGGDLRGRDEFAPDFGIQRPHQNLAPIFDNGVHLAVGSRHHRDIGLETFLSAQAKVWAQDLNPIEVLKAFARSVLDAAGSPGGKRWPADEAQGMKTQKRIRGRTTAIAKRRFRR